MNNDKTTINPVKIVKKKRWQRLSRSKWFYLVCIILLVGAFYFYRQVNSASAETRYIISAASKNTVINTISGTGQVSASNQIDLLPKIAADIIAVNIVSGQKLKTGDVVAQLDSSDLTSQVRQAKNSLDSARASLNTKLAGPSTQEISVSQKSVDSAKLSYESAKNNLSYVHSVNDDNLEKAQMQVDNANLSVTNAQRTYDNAVSTSGFSTTSDNQELDKAYADAKSSLANAQIALRSALVSADNILEKNNYNSSGHNYKSYLGVRNSQSLNDAENAYEQARYAYIALEKEYAMASSNWTNDKIEDLLVKTLSAAQLLQTLTGALSNTLLNSITSADFTQSMLDAYKQSATSQESAMISQTNSLQAAQRSITSAKLGTSSGNVSSTSNVDKAASDLVSAKNNLTSAQNSLKQAQLDKEKNLETANNEVLSKKNSYESSQAQLDLKIAKPRAVDLASYYLQISSAEANYQDALDKAAEATIKSPIDGIIAQVNKKAGDSITSGEALATIITEEKIATIALNEVDAAKVKNGQKATMTFSALEDLSITGSVVEVDSIGTVSQGVVSYNIKIVLDTQDERIKPQMTVSAEIVVDQSIDVLTVPNAAIKTDDNGASYVDILDYSGQIDATGVTSDSLPVTTNVTVGLSDDTNTEVTSGLQENVYVVTRTVTGEAAAVTTQKSAASLLGGGTGRGGMQAGGPPGM